MKLLLIIISIITVFPLFSEELINMNPDPDGTPWWAGKLRQLDQDDWQYLAETPTLILPDSYRSRPLPDQIDNSQLIYFRPVFSQTGGSCGQASGVAYNFTYEISMVRDLSADIPINQYPTHFTWNFLNGGVGNGSWYWDGWDIIRKDGCVNLAEYGGMAYGGERRWLSGYGNYYSGMHNRSLEYFTIDVSSEEGLTTLKHWMNDHLDDSEFGGLANFAAGVSNYQLELLPEGTPEAGKTVVVNWCTPVNHALTFAGYNDSIRYDYNGDGHYTNDVDINHDGVVNMLDWEIGGLIVVNSWGTAWADEGKAYMMYKLLAEPVSNGGIWNNLVHVLKVRDEYEPLLTIKAMLRHDSRDKLKIYGGISADVQASEPEYYCYFPLFNYQGGPYYLQGGDQEYHKLIEIGLDITPLLSYPENGQPSKFFLVIENDDPDNIGSGEIVSFSVIEYPEGNETICPQTDIPILNNQTTLLFLEKTIDYLPVSIISENLPPAIPGEEYSYQLMADGGNPPYRWGFRSDYLSYSDILPLQADYGDQLTLTSQDNGYAEIDLDFDFPFYDTIYRNLTVTSDGSIIFTDEFAYVRNEENLLITQAITPYGADQVINSGQNEGIWLHQEENRATIRWKTSRTGSPWTNLEYAAQINSDGNIDFYYLNSNFHDSNWISGISKGDNVNFLITEISGSSEIIPDYHVHFDGLDFPYGMTISENGLFAGIQYQPSASWDIGFLVKDDKDIHTTKSLTFSVETTELTNNSYHTQIELFQNFPNPFIPDNDKRSQGTEIGFYLNPSTRTDLAIYNLKGELIKKFENSYPQNSAYRTVNWNGRDRNGNIVPAGVYLYQLKTDGRSITRKMVILP